MFFHWRLSDINSPQVSRSFLSILAVFNNAFVWMVSTRPPTSKSSSPFNNPLVTVPKAPMTIGIIVTFMFHSFCWLLYGLGFWPRLGDPFVYKSPIGVCVCHFLGQVQGCAYAIC